MITSEKLSFVYVLFNMTVVEYARDKIDSFHFV